MTLVTRTTSTMTSFLNLVTALTVACLRHGPHRQEEQIPLRLNLVADEVVDKLAEAA